MVGAMTDAIEKALEPFVPKDHGPQYPDMGASVAKFRKLGPISKMDKAERQAYGTAVETKIKSLQRAALMRGTPQVRSFEPIGDARVTAMRNRLIASADKERRERKPDEWKAMYDAAMKDKAAAEHRSRQPRNEDAINGKQDFEPIKIRGRLIVKAPIWSIGTTPPAIAILRNALRCKYSYRDGGYIATPAKLEKLKQMMEGK